MAAKTGILLINLGTPEGTGYWPMRRYLKEFLSDPQVIDRRGILWWMILNGIILTRRPRKSGRAYAKIWNRDRDESPLKTITRAQAERLARRCADRPDRVIAWAMRYGRPSIAAGLSELRAAGCEQVILFPLYPQYSGTTTQSALDQVTVELAKLRWEPGIRTVPPYFDKDAHIEAVSASVRHHLAGLDWKPDALIASFHGLPQAFIDKGDPYQQHCEASFKRLGTALGMSGKRFLLTYQSRPSRGVWIGPDLEQTLVRLARSGQTNLCVFTPGFAADCVETLEEVEIRAKETFLQNGGVNFSFIPCLNDSDLNADMMERILREPLE